MKPQCDYRIIVEASQLVVDTRNATRKITVYRPTIQAQIEIERYKRFRVHLPRDNSQWDPIK